MGEFLPSGTSSSGVGGEIYIHGVRVDNKYQGFRFSHSCMEETSFVDVDDGKNFIFEVLGDYYRDKNERGENVLRQDTIAVLRGDDAVIYQMLQWDNYWRWHPDVQLAYGIVNFGKMLVVFLLLAIGGAVFLPIDSLALRMLISIVGGLMSAILGVYLYNNVSLWLRKRRAFNKTCSFVRESMRRNNRPSAYYHDLFTTLSRAASKDKAESARKMAKVF